MRKRWFFVTLLVGVLALGITGGTVLAHDGGVGGDSPLGKFTSRVANILGVDEAQVQDALDQASREIQDESLQLKLDRMVESGRLTQEQADAYLEWYVSRPDGLFSGFKLRGFGGHDFFRGGMFGRHGMGFWHQMPSEPAPESSESISL
jgi:hypothetical protein